MSPTAFDPTAIIRQAYELARKGEVHRAGMLCGAVLEQNNEHAEAWLLSAVVAIQSGNATGAATAARRSLQSDPTRAAAHALLADALLMLHQPQEALDSYQAALGLNRDLVSAHLGRGNAFLALQCLERAESPRSFTVPRAEVNLHRSEKPGETGRLTAGEGS